MASRSLVALLAVALFIPAAVAQIAPEDVVRLNAVGAVAMSPDGRHVAYTLTQPRAEEEEPGRGFSELFVRAVDGGEPVRIAARTQPASQPTWTPDGRLAFISRFADQHAQAQVYAVPAAGGTPERLTDSPEGVMSYAFGPNGAVFYLARAAENPAVAAQRARGFDQIVFGENERPVRLFVEQDGERRRLTPEHLTVREFAVSYDGAYVAVQTTEDTSVDADMMFRSMHLVTVADASFESLAPTEGKLGPMAWSPDGRHVAFLSATRMSDPLPHHLFVVEVGSNAPRNATPNFEGTIEWMAWTGADEVLFAAVEGTRTTVNRLTPSSGAIARALGGGDEIARSLSLAADHDAFAAAVNTRMHPNELFVGSVSAGTLRRLTDHNPWLGERRMARQETVSWTAPDGMTIEGVLVYPLDYVEGQRYPLAILPHGGPEGISIDGWNTRALYPSHVMALEGYAVLKPNYRGSGGRGPAFSMANHRDLGGAEFDDVLAGIDHLAEIGLVDPNRVGISGTSYGGYFSAWATARHPERFRAGITFAGLSNWISFMGTTDIPHEMSLVHWDLYYWENPELYHDRSPVTHIDENTPPTLVVHGLADERVHPEQSIQLHGLLRLRGATTGLVLYPREPHGLLERAHQLDFMQRQVEWFNTYVMPETTAAR